ncbi:MAG: MBL fold metallo-hydrolase [Brevinematales bacterium]|nr:MBL fold metallo-hydrolase [Brevinematales bacterium]
MELFAFTSSDFASNTYVVRDETRMLCIDPACPEAREKLSHPFLMVATHGHFDHILLASRLAETYGAPLYIHPQDMPMLKDPYLNLSAYFGEPLLYTHTLLPLQEGPWQAWDAEIWSLPGHSPGSVGLYFPRTGWFFGGDLLFAFSVGRTDLPGGEEALLWQSVEKALSLPDETKVFPGHGEPFTIGEFRSHYQRWRKR